MAYSSFWVGLGGVGKGGRVTIEQTGIDAICFHRTAYYEAFSQLWPEHHVTYRHTVQPGDTISASVTTNGNGHFTLVVADTREGWTQKTPATFKKARLGSAEVIAEDPGYRDYHPLKLADFGTASFTDATANRKSFNYYGLNDLERDRIGPPVKTATSPLSNGAFTVTWKHP